MSDRDFKVRALSAERRIGLLLFGAALALYLATMSWAPCPGLPTQALRMHLEMGPPSSGALDSLWGWLVRGFARLPGLSVAGWTGLFSALCGSACVGLMGRLMTRVIYRGVTEVAQRSMIREVQARQLSGWVAGLYLAGCIPFWVVSTRSLPGAFHLLMLLAAAWSFSEYQQRGQGRHLALLGLLLGAGITEFATFIVYLPLAAFLVAREMYRRKVLGAWRPHLLVWGGLLFGLSLYPVNAYVLFRQGAPFGVFASPWQAWAQVLQQQAQLILQVRHSSGFLIAMFFSLVPWLMLFAMSRRSPWFYEWDQVAMRLIFVGGLMGVLYNAPFAPFRLLGMGYLMVTPHLVLAACMGYMAGEFWIIGESQRLRDASLPKRIARRAASLFAWLLPILVLLGAAFNWRVVDGRRSGDMHAAALQVLDRLAGRDVVFSSGLLDDSLSLAIWERNAPVRLVSTSRISSSLYLQRLAWAFPEAALRDPLRKGDFNLFMENLFFSGAGAGRVAILDLPDAFREFGHLVPDGFFYRMETSVDPQDLPAWVEAQRPCWTWMERIAAHPAPKANLVRAHQDQLRWMVSKVANNLGVMQAERGDEAGALETFRAARRIYPENLSVLLNLMELGRGLDFPEEAEVEEDWAGLKAQLDKQRWALAVRFGYVWNVREWVRRGWVWALSGAPTVAEAVRITPAPAEDESDEQALWLDQAYLQWGQEVPHENRYRARLAQDGKDTGALMGLCRLALRRRDPDMAEAYRAEALRMGLPEQAARFDQAMARHVRGDRAAAVAALHELTRQTPDDARVWMALVLLTEASDPVNRRAVRALQNHSSAGLGARLALAWMHLSRRQWAEAQAELEAAIQMDARNAQAWELMVTLARVRGNRKHMESSLRTLLEVAPGHPFQRIQKAYDDCRRGAWAEAEAGLRAGLRQSRNPDLLGALADIILSQNGAVRDARALLDEAVRKQPFNPVFRCTRSELNLKEGRLDEAGQDLRQVLETMPDHVQAWMISIRLHLACGEGPAALARAEALARRASELPREQRIQLETLIEQMRTQ
ncbi:MAG: DUF2723 domain-containing protein [Opitutae bacterium]|nr:DUF2723 domain-containing protein [Opitutae bacterium]